MPHYHRWEYMRSWVLSGSYKEELFFSDLYVYAKDKQPIRHLGAILRSRFTTHSMTRGIVHRVSWWHYLCWTLFYTNTPKLDWEGDPIWGYYDLDGTHIRWQDAIPAHLRVPSI